MEIVLMVALGAIAVGAIAFAVASRGRQSPPSTDNTSLLQLTQSLAWIQTELRGLTERLSGVEQYQRQANQGLSGTAEAIRQELSKAKTDLTELQANARARQQQEQQTAESIRRLESIIAGTQSKGSAGENILDAVFAKLPPEWQVRDYRVGNKAVEFGLRLPNGHILPVDSKWPATNLIEQFVASQDMAERQKLKSDIQRAVIAKAREVKKYVDPNLTVSFGVAAIPDAAYDLCAEIQVDSLKMNVAIISYSMFLPYLLLVFHTILKTSQSVDLQKMESYLQCSQQSLEAVREELEGRLPRAIKSLSNSRDDMALHLSKVRTSLISLQAASSPSQANQGLPPAAPLENREP
ncbi:MAG: DNA recombination protein RmuC [SAR202 cluster bacterium]|nr:DNA recombination protein RmuC [SAR202 cluster bacterium]